MMYMPLMFADEAKAPQTSEEYQAAKAAGQKRFPRAKYGSIEVRPLNQWSQKA